MSENKQDLEVLWTPNQLARYLSVHKITIYRWIKQGEIKVIRISNRVRIPRSEVERLAGKAKKKLEK